MPSTSPISRVRFALLVAAGVYPLITGLAYAVAPLTADWPIWQRNLMVTPTMVAAIVYGLVPCIHANFGRFLRPGDRERTHA